MSVTDPVELDYLIVGAGPAGLQLAYYLQREGWDYRVVERASAVGEFFARFPRHRTLLSINKRHTGFDDPEVNLRWDWNSLLGDDAAHRFTEYSREYFPHADDYRRYLVDFAARHELVVDLDTEVTRISRPGERFEVEAAHPEGPRCYRPRRLIVATGRATPRSLDELPGAEHCEEYSSVSIDPEDFVGQRVAILGKGNSGFETAENLLSVTEALHLISPHPIRLAWHSHYVGDLRAINNDLLDTYQLKSQNTIIDANTERLERLDSGRLRVHFVYTHAHGQRWSVDVDRVIACTGFVWDDGLFAPELRPKATPCGRFPSLSSEWESVDVPDLYFAGALMHGLDYRRAFSGFIHGFRYNVEVLARFLAARYEGRPIDADADRLPRTANAVLARIFERVHGASSLFQQPGFLADLFVLEADGVLHLRDLPRAWIHERAASEPRMLLTMEYGKLGPDEDPFRVVRNPDDGRASKFIHPVLRLHMGDELRAVHHVPEDLENDWHAAMYRDPCRTFLEGVLEHTT